MPSGTVVTFSPLSLFESGVALANPTSRETSVQIRLLASRPSGSLAPKILLLTGRAEPTARFLSELFPEIEDIGFQATAVINSYQPIAVTTLRTLEGLPAPSLPLGSAQR